MAGERSTGRTLTIFTVLAVLIAMGSAGCWRDSSPGGGDEGKAPGNPSEAHVADITLGRALGDDGMIREDSRTNSYWTTDKFYVAVTTDGSVPNATVKARWKSSEGAVVGEDTKTAEAGTKPVVLQATPPDGRWKAGDYTVEVLVNDVSAGTKDLAAR
ncbi:MAG TPA: hypothetical protein VGK30_18880 [Candidatus Binatia bacterium]